MKPLRIGILSTAGIAQRNWKAIFHSGNAVVSAVASRDMSKAAGFVAECQKSWAFEKTPRAWGSYEALLSDPELDAVYVPLPTALRKNHVIDAARRGLHVLCEKPCAISRTALDEMTAACAQNKVQFMDGVMFMHSPRMERIRAILADPGQLGPLRRIQSSFTFRSVEGFEEKNIRAHGGLEPAGCLGDLGWYCLRFALWVMDWQLPKRVTARIHAASPDLPGHPSAPLDFSGEMTFGCGVTFGFYCSFRTMSQQWVHVGGRDGWLRVADFVHPFNSYNPVLEVNRVEVATGAANLCPDGAEPAEQGHPTAQDTLMWRNFAKQIASGRLNEEWPRWATQTQTVQDACLRSAREGVDVCL